MVGVPELVAADGAIDGGAVVALDDQDSLPATGAATGLPMADHLAGQLTQLAAAA